MDATRPQTSAPFRPHLLLLALIATLAVGCDRTDESGQPAAGADEHGAGRIAAVIDGAPISDEAVDASLRLDLHDLDYERYRLRRARLDPLIRDRLGGDVPMGSPAWEARVEVRLAPPPPPRLTIPDDETPIRGPRTAPITIVEFIDFESSHCRSLQPVLTRILERYPDRVRLIARDLPLPFHRNAWQFAAAAHCAAVQKTARTAGVGGEAARSADSAYWSYHDQLLLEQPRVTPADLTRLASLLGLDVDRFSDCLGSGRSDATIERDRELAGALGVRRAGTIFVNGLYLTGHPRFEEIDRTIRSELERLGLERAEADAAGDMPPSSSANAARGPRLIPPDADPPLLPPIPSEALAEPEVVLTLSRAEVDRALEDRPGLDRKLGTTRGEYSGQRLLKLERVAAGDFYERLGLEERDVLLIVNGEFVTLEHNSIWEAFETREEVTIVVLRRGLPHTYAYRIR